MLAGDFNCDFLGTESSLRNFVEKLDLKTHNPLDNGSATYPSWGPTKRIDWILASKDMNFISHDTLNKSLSDHLAIVVNFSV